MILCHTWVVVFSYHEEICLRLESARSDCDLAAVISDKPPKYLAPLRIARFDKGEGAMEEPEVLTTPL